MFHSKSTLLAVALSLVTTLHLVADDPANAFKQDPSTAIPEAADIVAASAQIQGGTVKVSFTVAGGTPTQWHHIYFNTDDSGSTGFIHSANPEGGKGMDFLIEPNFLYHWSGAEDQRGWHWDKVQPIEATISGQTVTYEFPASTLSLPANAKIDILIETMNDNYAQTLDTLPRNPGVWSIKADASAEAAPSPLTPPVMNAQIATPDPQARVRFKEINTYACYYGSGDIEGLSHRDAVIVETRNLKPGDVAAIKKKGRSLPAT